MKGSAPATGFDIKTDVPTLREAKLADFSRLSVAPQLSCKGAVSQASVILSLVTADQAILAARQTARHVSTGALYLDMNSVSPVSKRSASELIASAGGRYADIAIMAPVQPGSLAVPLLVSGPAAEEAHAALEALGFTNVRNVGGEVGAASAIKMIRSVMIKGIEALTAECLLAAEAAGVTCEVLSSLGGDWTDRANYNIDRMLVHGVRRAAEMEEVCRTLTDLGIEPVLSRGTAARQRDLGERGIIPPPSDLAGKLSAIVLTEKAAPA